MLTIINAASFDKYYVQISQLYPELICIFEEYLLALMVLLCERVRALFFTRAWLFLIIIVCLPFFIMLHMTDLL